VVPEGDNLRPEEPRYGTTYAFLLDRKGDTAKRSPSAEDRGPESAVLTAYVMLGTIYEKQGKAGEAKKVYRKAAENAELPEPDRAQFRNKLQSMGNRKPAGFPSTRRPARVFYLAGCAGAGATCSRAFAPPPASPS